MRGLKSCAVEDFMAAFDCKELVPTLTIDLSQALFWGITSVGAPDKTVIRSRREGTAVNIEGMKEAIRSVPVLVLC
ncbi:MAG: hypothetical protein KDI01_05895 [Halioglobus sp.]|nr:hypothetical protein [Halioglobus sp.]MCB1686707.1 hypothetical protein [Pseudomonadales bacterium]